MEAAPADSRYAGMVAALAARHAQPLWDRYHRVTTREPRAPDAPMAWAWSDMEPLVERAVHEVSMEDAERRVLLLTHPAFQGRAATTTNLLAGLQTLLPGETARAHRHSLQAIRFVMSGNGAETTVNQHRCPMEEGDLVLTPAWTWHEHVHRGTQRMVWLDGLDLPLLQHLDSMFFEIAAPGATHAVPSPSPAGTSGSDMVALGPDPDDTGNMEPNRYRYSWQRARQALAGAPPRADGSRWLRYVDARSGGAALPTLDCFLLACARQRPTQPTRSTGNAVAVVVQGSGSSRVGAQTITWQRHDVFTLPHWNWVSHTAACDDAVVFLMTDRAFLAMIGYLREETQA